MARYYEMTLEVEGVDPTKTEAIFDVMREHWTFDKADCWVSASAKLGGTGRSNLCGGESEEEFAWRITRAIWIANGVYCRVQVHATYLEELPYNSYQLDADEYAKLGQVAEQT